MNQEDKIAREIWAVLERLKVDFLLTPNDQYATYEVVRETENSNYPSVQNQLKIIKKLEHLGAVKVVREFFFTRRGTTMADAVVDVSKYQDADPKGLRLDILQPRFDEVYAEYSRHSAEPISPPTETKEFTITVQDRGVWVNEFLLSKPHAAGKNLAFLEYLLENPDKQITREVLPPLIKKEMAGASFSKVLHELGFKGEILKAFFPQRAKSQLQFRNAVSKSQLEKERINLDLLLQELRLAHIKSSPK